ncbi:MAG: WD40/YVTN/BNR-like repeat-containing protein, partial [Gemmatimonadales bacterium]
VTAVTGVASQPATFYMGSTGGGVWKTTDYGRNWVNISDGFFATGSIGAMDVAESDPNIVYVGTGSDGIRSNVITGRGVYKSTDAGETWSFVGLRDVGQIGAVIISPDDPDVVFIAGMGNAFAPSPERGVYRTTNGGASWDQVLFISDSTGAVDLEFAPDNPNEIYASMWRGERKPWTIISGAYEGGVYKSSDGGDTWTHMTDGLPQGLIGKSDLAVSPADPDRVYVLMEAPQPDDGLYRSDDRGRTWRQVTSYNPILNRPFYYTNVDADPTNADIVYVNNEGFYKSTDGGENFERGQTPHGDNHDMWINPIDPNIFVQSNDGGANVTLDGGITWSSQHNQPTAELYQVAIDDRFPYWVYAGQQDNSTIMVPSLPPRSMPGGPTAYWMAIGGCETGPAIPKPGNPDIVYSNCKGRFGRYNQSTGQEKQYYVGMGNIYGHNTADLRYRFQRVSPIHVSPHDANIVYHASQYLHRTTDEGVTWETISPDLTARTPETQMVSGGPITRDITGEEFYSTLYAVQESPIEKGQIWVGANDGPIHMTRDGGANWTNVTPPDLPPSGRVQTVEPSPHRPNKAYVAVLRYQLNDWEPHIYRTNDYGRSWTRLTTGTNGIPADFPTRVIREDPDREGLLYAGTEFGMFVSFDDGANWQSLQLNLPATPVTDMRVHQKDLVISTMGRSFWILDDLTPLHQLDDRVASSRVHLFAPRDAYRMRYGGRRARRGPSPADPEFPPAGVMIDYYLADTPDAEVTLEILDEDGALVRGFSSSTPPAEWNVPEQPGMREFRLERVGGPRLAKEAGMHRFVWNMEHAGAWDENREEAGGGGPMVVPGAYQVRLTVGNWSDTQPFELMMDPRVTADGVTYADLEEQVTLSLQVRDALSRARMAAVQIADARKKLAEQTDETARARTVDDALAAIEAKLVTADLRSYPTPMLTAQLSYLYTNLDRADQKPGRDAHERFVELDGLLQGYIRELERILRANVI